MSKTSTKSIALSHPKFYTFLEINPNQTNQSLLISNSVFILGEVRMINLQSELLLKTTEALLKIFNLKVIVKDWLPALYVNKYTNSIGLIASSLSKK